MNKYLVLTAAMLFFAQGFVEANHGSPVSQRRNKVAKRTNQRKKQDSTYQLGKEYSGYLDRRIQELLGQSMQWVEAKKEALRELKDELRHSRSSKK